MPSTDVDYDKDGEPRKKKIKAEGLQRGGPGLDYQVQLLMFFAHQGYHLSTQKDKDFLFELGTERAEAGKFDDIIVRHKQNKDEKWNYLLIQAKYTGKQDPSRITTTQLLSDDSTAPFTLLKYFSSFLVSKRILGEKIGSCAIVTNNNFNYNNSTLKIEETRGRGKSFYLKKLKSDEVNPIFQTPAMKEAKYFKFDETKGMVEELKDEFKKSYDVIEQKQKRKDTEKDILKNLKDIKENEVKFDEEVRNFLNTLLYVVDLPDRSTIREIMKSKIGEELQWLDDWIIDTFNIMMFNYTITSGKPFLKGSGIKKFFLKMRQIINDIVFRVSYYPRMQNAKINFVDKEIIKSKFNDFLSTQSEEKILLLKTNSMLLSAIKLNQILKDLSLEQYSYYNKHNFVNHEALIEIANLEDETIKSFKVEDGCNLLIIICDEPDVNADKIKDLRAKLYNGIIGNTLKKVVFIMEHNLAAPEIEMNKECFLNINDVNNFSDLTDDSKKYLLDKSITFQAKSIPLKQLYFKLEDNEITSEQLNQLNIDVKTLEILISGSIKIVKQFSMSNLEGAYRTFYEEINTDVLIERIQESDDGFFIISGIDESEKKNALIKNLRANARDQQITIDLNQICELPRSGKLYINQMKKVILVDSKYKEEDFRKLCRMNPDENFYRISWKNEKFIFRSSYYPKFLERQFKYPVETVIPDDMKLELLKNNNDNKFFFTGTHKLDDLFEVLQLQDEAEREKLNANYQSKNIIMQEENDEGKTFSKLIDNAKDKNVYWLHIESKDNSKRIIWCDVRREPVLEKKLRDIISDKSSVIIDKPGMGKSTTLTILSDKMPRSHWVMLITLRDWQEAILSLPENIDNNVIVKFLSETKNLRTPLEENLVKHVLDKNYESGVKLLLLFDGFDEIRKYDTENVGKTKLEGLLRFLKERTLSTIWITAREHDASRLKSTLSVFDIKFEPLHDDSQRQYFKDVWSNSLALNFSTDKLNKIFSSKDSKFQEYYGALSSASKKILENKHNDFMGIPLTLRLFAEGFRSKFMKFINTGENICEDFDNINILKLYKYFIDEKFQIFLREKTNLSSGFTKESEDWFKDKLMKLHYRLAFHELFGEEKTKQLLGMKQPFKEAPFKVDSEQLSELLSFGIIRSTRDNHYQFLHRTLAEYFISELFVYILKNKERNNPEKYKKIISFIDENIFTVGWTIISKFLGARCEQDSTLKDVWHFISGRDAKLENVLGQAEDRNIFTLNTMIYDNVRSTVKESFDDLRTKVSRAIQWNEANTSFTYTEGGSRTENIKKLIEKSLIETDIIQLKSTLNFLLPLLNKSEFALFTHVLTTEKIMKIFSHYMLQLEKQNRLEFNIKFMQDFCKKLQELQINHYRQRSTTGEEELFEFINQNFREALVSGSCEHYCVNFVLGVLILTKEMAEEFKLRLSTSKCVFNDLITQLLVFKYFAKYDSTTFTDIDASALLDMFQTVANNNGGLSLSEKSLRGLLECIKQLLLPGNISQENFLISMKCLITLKNWNFRLVYKDNCLSLHRNTSEDYSLSLELPHVAKITKLLLSTSRGKDASFNLEKECNDTFQSILEAKKEG